MYSIEKFVDCCVHDDCDSVDNGLEDYDVRVSMMALFTVVSVILMMALISLISMVHCISLLAAMPMIA
jgi:hypothetical protein